MNTTPADERAFRNAIVSAESWIAMAATAARKHDVHGEVDCAKHARKDLSVKLRIFDVPRWNAAVREIRWHLDSGRWA